MRLRSHSFPKQAPAPQRDGRPALRRAIELNNKDFDAYASLGGVLSGPIGTRRRWKPTSGRSRYSVVIPIRS